MVRALRKITTTFLFILLYSIYPAEQFGQIIGSDVFLKGMYTELGLCRKGALGSGSVAPPGYHPRTLGGPNILGFVCDIDMDGWDIGVPDFFGDYFTPGIPQEGWDIQFNNNWASPDDPGSEMWSRMWRHPGYGGATASNISPASATMYLISGGITDYYISGRTKIAVWEGNLGNTTSYMHLGIRQEVLLDTVKRYFVIKVTFKAKNAFWGSPEFYYNRTLDSDNDLFLGGSFPTRNEILAQPTASENRCLVKASGRILPEKNVVMLGTKDCRAKAYLLRGAIFPTSRPKSMYNTGASVFTAVGDTIRNNTGIGIVYKIPPMSFGDSTTISFAYVLTEDELDEALALTEPSISVSGETISDGDSMHICTHDSIMLHLTNSNGLEWGEWHINGIPSGIEDLHLVLPPIDSTTTLSIYGTSDNCINDTVRISLIPNYYVDTITDTVCSGSTYSFADTVFHEEVSLYPFKFTDISGCDSVMILNVHFATPDTTEVSGEICDGSSFTFFGTVYSEPGVYYYFDTTGPSCDVIHRLTLESNEIITNNLDIVLCSGTQYLFGDTVIAAPVAGLTQTFTSVSGCDSIVNLTLAFSAPDTIVTHAAICDGESYVFGGTSYTTAGTYINFDTMGLKCDTIRMLLLDVGSVYAHTIDTTICSGMTFSLGSHIFSAPIEGFSDTLTSIYGCDSIITLNLSIAAADTVHTTDSICPGNVHVFFGTPLAESGTYMYFDTVGTTCDTVHIIDLWVYPEISLTIDTVICQGQSIEFYDSLFSTSVTGFTGTYEASTGCDSTVILNLTVLPADTVITVSEICSGSAFPFFGTDYSSPGTYFYWDTAGAACDTLRILNLTVNDTIRSFDTLALCYGDSVMLGSTALTETGVYTLTGITADGCDSIHTLVLNVLPSYFLKDSITVCQNQLPLTFHGILIPEGTASDAHFDTAVFMTENGCDSLINIAVTVLHTSQSESDTSVCFGTIYEWQGVIIDAPGSYTDTQTNAHGCDSVITLNVSYREPPVSQDSAIIACGTAQYNGTAYTRDTLFTDTFRSIYMCDSLYLSLHISVLREPKDTIIMYICPGTSYNFNGRLYASNIIVTDTFIFDNGCDSTITLDLRIHPSADVDVFIDPPSAEPYCIMDSITLAAEGASHYAFYTTHSSEPYTYSQYMRTRLPEKENIFYVVGYNEHGCSDTAALTVLAEVCCDIIMPNAFSPNGDGLNDNFGPVVYGHPLSYTMQVFDRWGQLVFVSYDIGSGWNGTKAGTLYPAGTYYYTITGKCFDNTSFFLNGDVTLIR